MEKHIVKVLETSLLTHNVKRFLVQKPDDYAFVPGQATEISINKPTLEDELRPFTMTSHPQDDHLEFIIKIYPDHHGMTENLLDVVSGDELIVHEVFGSIKYRGPGLFLAGGAGITPFIAIFRYLTRSSKSGQRPMTENTLLFANQTIGDVILRDELKNMLGVNYHDVIEQSNDSIPGRRIDRALLMEYYSGHRNFYVCGPGKFTIAMVQHLEILGIAPDQIVIEQ